MDLKELDGKLFAVVLTDEKDQSETFFGTAHWDGSVLIVERGPGTPSFTIRQEWFERIQPVASPIVKAVLNSAEYWIRLQLGTAAPDRKGTSARDDA